jgi:hypothetical protein
LVWTGYFMVRIITAMESLGAASAGKCGFETAWIIAGACTRGTQRRDEDSAY